ncbi:hypothetical protein SCLCIDRAFT_19902 [Scleroderma citrinum Foug A]|uniref:Uncharacterized protein n=1 Tax=Scleroderma citrinum Foug A TaxID=1036808 RepID=A0A0C3E972_9AGAM|nr:hypothetical protein SCLCIDRAFT_19902 [Scleroderma citrinum Foug A]
MNPSEAKKFVRFSEQSPMKRYITPASENTSTTDGEDDTAMAVNHPPAITSGFTTAPPPPVDATRPPPLSVSPRPSYPSPPRPLGMPPITPMTAPPCISPPPEVFGFTSGPVPAMESPPARTAIFSCVPPPTVDSPPRFCCVAAPTVNSPPGTPFTPTVSPHSDRLHWPVVNSPPSRPSTATGLPVQHVWSTPQNSPSVSLRSQATLASASAPTATPFPTLDVPICESPRGRVDTAGQSAAWSPRPGSQSLTQRQSSSSAGLSGSMSSPHRKHTNEVDDSPEPRITSLPQSVHLSDTVVQPPLNNPAEGSPIEPFSDDWYRRLSMISQQALREQGPHGPRSKLAMALQIMGAVLPSDRLPLHPCHNGMLIAVYSYYANTLVDARRKWTLLVEKYRRMLWY